MKSVISQIFLLFIAAAIQGNCSYDEHPEESDGNWYKSVFCNGNRYQTTADKLKKGKCPLEKEVNQQINMELVAFYEYLNLGYYFAHESYSLPHFSKYFLDHSNEKLKDAQNLMQYQILRGAHVNLRDVSAPQKKSFSGSCDGMDHAYNIEINITKQTEETWRAASIFSDIHLANYLKTKVAPKRYESLKKLQDMIGTMKRLGICHSFQTCNKLGEFQFDNNMMTTVTI